VSLRIIQIIAGQKEAKSVSLRFFRGQEKEDNGFNKRKGKKMSSKELRGQPLFFS